MPVFSPVLQNLPVFCGKMQALCETVPSFRFLTVALSAVPGFVESAGISREYRDRRIRREKPSRVFPEDSLPSNFRRSSKFCPYVCVVVEL